MRRAVPRTIGARLALLNGVVFLATMLALGAIGLLAVDGALGGIADRILLDEAEEAGRHVAEIESPAALEAYLRDETEGDSPFYVVHYRVTGAGGRPVARSAAWPWDGIPLSAVPPSGAQATTVRVEDDPHRYRLARRRIERSAYGPVDLDVALHLVAEDHILGRLRTGGLLALPLALAVSVGAGIFLARRALRPTARIDRAARRIGGTPSGARLPRSGNGDELDRLAETLNDMLERLEAAAARNLQFVGDVAHEVRTPLSTIRARVEGVIAALDGAAAAPAAGENAERALEEVSRLQALVQNLLLISRADEGHTALARAPLDLVPIAREVTDFFGPVAEERGIALRVDLPPTAWIVGEPPSLHRLVANLLDNALHYTDDGGTVDLRLRAEGDRVRIEVEDTGCGVPPALRPRLFERFFRAPGSRSLNEAGCGLGLALVRAVARAHGGEATYEPRPDGPGSIFRVEVQAAPAAPAAEAARAARRTALT